MMEIIFRSALLLLVLQTAIATAPFPLPSGLHASFAPGLTQVYPDQQNIPCTLYENLVELTDGSQQQEWFCVVFGVDATNAGSAISPTTVEVQGIEHVLAANSSIQSGVTTVLAQGAGLSNHTLTIGSGNALTFGQVDTSSTRRANRRLSTKSGDISVLVVRVTTADASLTKTIAEISGDVFGTAGTDTINLKSVVEDCSNNVARINPGSGTGSACRDNDNAVFDFSTGMTGVAANCAFFNDFFFSASGDICDRDFYATAGQVSPTVDASKTARTECCICGGTLGNYNNNVVDGVMDLELSINAVGSTSHDVLVASAAELEVRFNANSIDQVFDNVMLCFPSGTTSGGSTNWVAYAGLNSYYSVYNGDKWCANEVTQVHEVGHNMGLL
mmetsp:Transcript_44802/g.108248  ORF Transcript_44802/g.108248 Transcript_44802/m.108248 type:complete len:388 (-) Transcript_44802:1983-3146(-)